MNKAQLIEALASYYEGSKREAAKALNAVVETVTYTTASGEKVSITGFGVFERIPRAARMVRNPRTGERKRAKATAVPRFRAGTDLKAYVSGAKKVPRVAKKALAARIVTAAKSVQTDESPTRSTANKATAAKTPTTRTAGKQASAPAKTTGRAASATPVAAKSTVKKTAGVTTSTPAAKKAAEKTTAEKTSPTRTAKSAASTTSPPVTAKTAPAKSSTGRVSKKAPEPSGTKTTPAKTTAKSTTAKAAAGMKRATAKKATAKP